MNSEYQLHMMIKRLVKLASRLEKPRNISVNIYLAFKSEVSRDCTDKVRKLLYSDPEKAGDVVHPRSRIEGLYQRRRV